MKKIFTIIALIIAIPLTVNGATAEQVISEVITNYNKSNIISADYTVSADGINSTGKIIMSQQKFCILSDDLKCWYDGKTQWSYLSHIGEVNITEPTSDELEQTNPYAALMNINADYTVQLIDSGNSHQLKLTPKSSYNFAKEIELTINKSTKQIEKALFINQDNSEYLITISNYATDSNYTDTIFTYDPSQLPAGTPVIDLR